MNEVIDRSRNKSAVPTSKSSDGNLQHGVSTETKEVKNDHGGMLDRGLAGYRWYQLRMKFRKGSPLGSGKGAQNRNRERRDK